MNLLDEAIIVTFVLLVGAAGCNIETTPHEDSEPGVEDTSATVRLTDGFHLERYGIGAGWYDYDSQTHAITPLPHVYRVTSAELDVAFRVESYYDDQGTSGFFSLRTRALDTSEVATLVIGANAKEAPVCVDLGAPAEVDCGAPHHLVLRTDLRVVPAAGFAVQNPSVYTSSHFTAATPMTVQRAGADTLDTLPEAWSVLPDAKSRRADSLLAGRLSALADGESTDIFVQATADMRLVAWSATRAGDGQLSLEAACEDLAASQDAQVMPDVGGSAGASVTLDAESMAYVDLCAEGGPAVVATASQPPGGLWASTDNYDLIVERFDGQLSLRLAAGHQIWSTGTTDIAGSPDVPASLWE